MCRKSKYDMLYFVWVKEPKEGQGQSIIAKKIPFCSTKYIFLFLIHQVAFQLLARVDIVSDW